MLFVTLCVLILSTQQFSRAFHILIDMINCQVFVAVLRKITVFGWYNKLVRIVFQIINNYIIIIVRICVIVVILVDKYITLTWINYTLYPTIAYNYCWSQHSRQRERWRWFDENIISIIPTTLIYAYDENYYFSIKVWWHIRILYRCTSHMHI